MAMVTLKVKSNIGSTHPLIMRMRKVYSDVTHVAFNAQLTGQNETSINQRYALGNAYRSNSRYITGELQEIKDKEAKVLNSLNKNPNNKVSELNLPVTFKFDSAFISSAVNRGYSLAKAHTN